MTDEEAALFRNRFMSEFGYYPLDLSYVDELSKEAELMRSKAEQGTARKRDS